MEIAEFDQWAGELEDIIIRGMAQQLMKGLDTVKVSLYPWPRHRNLDYQIRIDILRFDGALNGKVALQGTWTLVEGDGLSEKITQAFDLSQHTQGETSADLVATMSALVTKLSQQIVDQIALM